MQLDIMEGMLPPGSTNFDGSMTYHLDTDQQGRVMLSAIVFRLRMILGVGVFGTVIALNPGMFIAVPVAYFCGKVDAAILRVGELTRPFDRKYPRLHLHHQCAYAK